MARRTGLQTGTEPYWIDSASIPTSRSIDRNLDADVVVVGGGITGLTTACLLAESGRSVVVLERGRCGQVDTGHTTAHVTMVTDARLGDLVDRFGRTHAQAVWDAGLAAAAQIDSIVRAHEISCSFEWVPGYLHAPKGQANRKDADDFQNEASLARELGFDASYLHDVPFVGGPGICFENQARFHPRKYLAALAIAARLEGVTIFEHSDAIAFTDEPLGVKANGHEVRCKDVVVATHNPRVGLDSLAGATLFQTKLALYTSYVVAGRVPHGTVPDALFWDTADPYRYLRLDRQRAHDLVILGGDDHKTGQVSDTDACYERLEQALTDRLPDISLTHRWSGQVIETPDGLPYIGRTTDHQYVATGFAGNGMTFGTLAGMIISDAITGRRNPWAELFDANRTAIRRGMWDYLKENADYPYYLMRSRFAGAEGSSFRSVRPGEGKIIENQGTKIAAYRQPDGSLTLRSATCTHMGCIVAWNAAEQTWDCPCHGSRFTPTGRVISGPAEKPLAEWKR
jgi:glycine/D-amino acid oxidase-like deaminating enzyme/nitrite reductase/ring-hydroxylating ferredoxin subunit